MTDSEELLNPIGEVIIEKLELSTRPGDLSGKVMGILDNKMGESTLLLENIARHLSERYQLAGTEARPRSGSTALEWAETLKGKCDFAVVGFGCSGVYTVWCAQAAVELEKSGIPTVMVCTAGLDAMCQAEARCMGLESLPLLSVPNPSEGRFSQGDIEKAAADLTDEIIFALTRPREQVAAKFGSQDFVAEAEEGITRPKNYFTLENVAAASTENATDMFYERGWTDGLPVVPPTRGAVDRMLTCSDRDPDEVIALLAPRMGRATVEKIAVNAVMAGGLPEYLPVVIAAVQAMAEPEFSLSAMQSTMNPVAPLTIVNGPLAEQLAINSSFNVFGPGWRANSTIGRAIRLILMNIGGGVPGTTDKSTQGQAAKYTFCIAENERESPWEPLHVERGFSRDVSTVTVAAVQANHNFIVRDRSPESILAIAADALSYIGANVMYFGGAGWPILALNPGLASTLAASGHSKADIKRYLFDHANVALSQFPEAARAYLDQQQIRQNADGDPIVQGTGRMEDIIVIVTGAGGGGHSQYLATMGRFIEPVTKVISFKDGRPIMSVEELRAKAEER